MRCYWKSIACWMLLAACAAPAWGKTLRVLTYNIHHAEGRDGVWDLNRIAGVINAAQPDLVALQELDQGNQRSGVTVFQLNQLAALTNMTGLFGKTINYQGGEYGNGMLIGPGLTRGAVTNHAMPSPGGGEARRVMQLPLSYTEGGWTRQFDFFATHLDHSNASNRAAQVEFINDLVAGSNRPAIIGGDFNLRETEDEYDVIREEWADPTVANPGITQIDYWFYRGGDQWSIGQQTAPIINMTTQVASDHFPWLAIVELKPVDANFDNDGDVDGADFLMWQRGMGASGVGLAADANLDRAVDAADLAVWRSQFGGAPAAPAPEPGTCLGGLMAAGALVLRRWRGIARDVG